METTQERLIRYLDDAWATEKALVDNLKGMADEVNDPDVRSMFLEHSRETQSQADALERRIRAYGEEPSGGKGFFNRMMSAVGDMVQGAHDEYDKTTQNLMKAFALENFEMAMYQALEAYASAVGDTDCAQLARAHFEQESNTASRVWPRIAPAAARAVQGAREETARRAA